MQPSTCVGIDVPPVGDVLPAWHGDTDRHNGWLAMHSSLGLLTPHEFAACGTVLLFLIAPESSPGLATFVR